MSAADDIDLGIACPNCNRKIVEKLGRLYRHKRLTCPKCGAIDLTGDGLREVKRALDDLERQIKKASTTVKLKL